ncbi:putative short-chain dehydrogenase protein [Phaeoacremonium minimum UCRPA7]|uniref:Putative short-chain dehydrogenase protein n=1 Tax=Phaeoacremonium minimum (strain UCR-PA7) TaxID=1286976 RepID=R8BDJ1_PHAM7|nr:putative short-chain dehydrogenase protein [Phaeoacremonium minimum UCRPA7]EON97362.1 putative short-chain dehydrogenase protein [Phaeoacremonium minimum UCRPA7]
MLRSLFAQWLPPSPAFTDKDVPNQSGKVFIVTGGNSGLGKALIEFLYPTGATIYMASRSKERAEQAIEEITSKVPAPATPAVLKYLHLDLDDLEAVKTSAAAFAAQETRLDVLFNNAGVGGVPVGSKTKQGLESHIGVNCVAPLLFTQELLGHLKSAAAIAPPNSVRVVWSASILVETNAPKGGIDFDVIDSGETQNFLHDYSASKCGNWFLAIEGAARYGSDGVISVAQNPGQLNTEVFRYLGPITREVLRRLVLYDVRYGVYTMLYAAFSPEITMETNGAYILPWGRIRTTNPRPDIQEAVDMGAAKKFWDWCEGKWKPHT